MIVEPPFKHEITVDLYGENYLLVSCDLNDQFYTGILLKYDLNPGNDENLRKLAQNDDYASVSRCLRYDQQKISSLCFRRTNFSLRDPQNGDSPFGLLQNQRPPRGIRRRSEFGSTVRLRPVPIQRNQNGVQLCSRCQNECGENSASMTSSSSKKVKKTSAGQKTPTVKNNALKTSRKRPNLETIFDKILQCKKYKKSDFTDRSILPIEKPCLKISLTKPPATKIDAAQPPIPKLKIKLSGGLASTSQPQPEVTQQLPELTQPQPQLTQPQPESPQPHFLRKDAVVWAKMRSYPYWPAKIFDILPPGNCACVVWSASVQYGYVDVEVLEPFLENFRKRYNAKRNVSYQKAVADALAQCSSQNADDVSNADQLQRLPLTPACRKFFAQYQRQRQFRTAQQLVNVKSEIFADDYAPPPDDESSVSATTSHHNDTIVTSDESPQKEDANHSHRTIKQELIPEQSSSSSKIEVKREIDDVNNDLPKVDPRKVIANDVRILPPKKLTMRTLSHDFSRKNRFLVRNSKDFLKFNRPLKNEPIKTPPLKIPTNQIPVKETTTPRPSLLKSPPKMPLKMTVKNLMSRQQCEKVDVSKIFQPLTLKNSNFSIPKKSTFQKKAEPALAEPCARPSLDTCSSLQNSALDSPGQFSPCDSPRLVIDEDEAGGAVEQTAKPSAKNTDDFDNVLSKLREMNELCENSSSSCSSTVSR